MSRCGAARRAAIVLSKRVLTSACAISAAKRPMQIGRDDWRTSRF
jgi:hypothetical protein